MPMTTPGLAPRGPAAPPPPGDAGTGTPRTRLPWLHTTGSALLGFAGQVNAVLLDRPGYR
ncbi:MAG: hypothetical protein JWQ81_7838 [Amycolatopsis sp.]|jgi:hypothetical protein|nr:hypothetical protein [Amycolatopsis sp.]